MYEYIQNSRELPIYQLMQCPPNCAAKQIVPFESRVPTLLSQEQIFVVFLLWRMYMELQRSLKAQV